MIRRLALASLLASCILGTSASTLCPPTNTNTAWSAQCFEGQGESRRVKAAQLGNLKADKTGMTTVLIAEPRELVAVDRSGKVLVSGIVHTGDFDYPTARYGIGRFTTVTRDASGKPRTQCGYFRVEDFRILVPASFDQCQPFKDEQALACHGCVAYCTETDCQDRRLVGGTGTLFGTDGKAVRSFELPPLEKVCAAPARARIEKLENGAAMLTCPHDPNNPFNKL